MGLIEKIVSGLEWRPLHAVDQTRFREGRLQAHHAVQWLARTARAYIPPQPDDSHTSLGWDRSIDGFMTHALRDGTRLSLQVANLTLALHEGGKAGNIHSLSLSGRHDKSIREWLGELLGARGLNPQALDAPSPYEIPAKAIAQGASRDLVGPKDALAELAAWFANAELSLSHIQELWIAGQRLTGMVQVGLLACLPAARRPRIRRYMSSSLSSSLILQAEAASRCSKSASCAASAASKAGRAWQRAL